jgi:hypothetical protein
MNGTIAAITDAARKSAPRAYIVGAIVFGVLVIVAAFISALVTDPVEAAVIAVSVGAPYVIGKTVAMLGDWRSD